MPRTEHFHFFLVEDFTHMAFSCAIEPLRLANWIAGEELYAWSYASENGETVKSSNQSVTQVHGTFDARIK